MPVLDEGSSAVDSLSAILKVHYAGLCGTDRGIWNRQAFRDQILNTLERDKKTQRIIGHEMFGEVVALGSRAGKTYNLKVGDFVACESHVVCNECYQCKNGEKHVCTNETILGISRDGCYAEYLKVPGHIIWKTDTSRIRPEVAAMQEPFGNAVHAASKVDVKGKTVAIFGLGPIGQFLTLVIRGLGAKSIIGIDPNPIARDMAGRLGIDYVIPLPNTGNVTSPAHVDIVTDEVKKITNGIGVDVSFEMAGFNSSVNNCLYATRRGGEIVLFGIKTGDFVFEDYNRLIVHGFTFHAVIGRQVWQTWETTRALLENVQNGVQEKMYNIILNKGVDTIVPIDTYTPAMFEEKMKKHPKLLLQF